MPGSIRVLFLYPNERGMSTVPPAIAVLSQVLKDKGHDVGLFDTTFYEFDDELALEDVDKKKAESLNFRPISDEEKAIITRKRGTAVAVSDFQKKVSEYNPHLIAVSVTETTFSRGLMLIESIRDRKITNIFGGVFPTFAPDLVMAHDVVDMVCVGEGENCLADLADRMASESDYFDVTNLCLRMPDGQIRRNPITRPVDINLTPPVTDIGLFGEKRFFRPMGGKVRKLLPVETHRGCPYTCTFCNSPSQNELYGSFGRMSFFRKKNISLVREEIQSHIEKWGVEYIYFWADTFLAWTNREFDEFCEMYQDIRLPFWCQTRIETITEAKLQKLKDIGLDRMTFGLEHGNEKFRREVVGRSYSNEDAIRLMKIPAELDITFSVNNMIGFPDETRELAFDTIELNRNFGSDNLSCSIFVPFHGTSLRRYAEARGYINREAICSVSNADESVMSMPQWDRADISRLRSVFSMYVKFPKSRWKEVESAETDPKLHAALSKEYIETYWSSPKAKIEDDLAEAAKGVF